jgi:hypothetical protein
MGLSSVRVLVITPTQCSLKEQDKNPRLIQGKNLSGNWLYHLLVKIVID